MAKSSKPGKQRKAQANAPIHISVSESVLDFNLTSQMRVAGLSQSQFVWRPLRVVRGDSLTEERVGGKRMLIHSQEGSECRFKHRSPLNRGCNSDQVRQQRRGCTGPCLQRSRHKVRRNGQVANATSDRR